MLLLQKLIKICLVEQKTNQGRGKKINIIFSVSDSWNECVLKQIKCNYPCYYFPLLILKMTQDYKM